MLVLGKNLKLKTTFKGLIYGLSGAGKTTLALSCPNPLLIDCDDGAERVESRFVRDVPVLKPQNYNEIIDIVLNKSQDCETIVIDTIGALVDYMLEQVMTDDPKLRQRDGSPTIKAYGAIKAPFKALLQAIKTQGKSVLFVGHAEEKDTGNGLVYRIQCAGSTANLLVGMLDFVGFMDLNGDQRMITFAPSERATAKNALGLEPNIKVPDTSVAGNTFMQKIVLNAIQKRAEEANSETQKEFDALIETMKEKVNAADSCAKLNEVLEWGGKVQHIWESKVKLWELVQAKGKELTCEFDKATKTFLEKKQGK